MTQCGVSYWWLWQTRPVYQLRKFRSCTQWTFRWTTVREVFWVWTPPVWDRFDWTWMPSISEMESFSLKPLSPTKCLSLPDPTQAISVREAWKPPFPLTAWPGQVWCWRFYKSFPAIHSGVAFGFQGVLLGCLRALYVAYLHCVVLDWPRGKRNGLKSFVFIQKQRSLIILWDKSPHGWHRATKSGLCQKCRTKRPAVWLL